MTSSISRIADMKENDSPRFTVARYEPANKREWDDFVEKSKNGTFLFFRGFMDYHADRFPDHSLIIYEGKKIRALLPATLSKGIFSSHNGLSYGGLVTDKKATVSDVLEIFYLILSYLRSIAADCFIYKPVPYIYSSLPSEEDLYALFRLGFSLRSRGVSSAIPRENRIKFRNIREAGVRKAVSAGLTVSEASDYESFWKILSTNLTERYGVRPVHSLEEIQLLAHRFPDNIKLYLAKKDEKVMAGVVVFDTSDVAHSQYIAASPEGKASGALDLVFHTLIDDIYKDKRYFDFGISTEEGGKILNENLIYQKEGFGGRAVCYDSYILSLEKRDDE